MRIIKSVCRYQVQVKSPSQVLIQPTSSCKSSKWFCQFKKFHDSCPHLCLKDCYFNKINICYTNAQIKNNKAKTSKIKQKSIWLFYLPTHLNYQTHISFHWKTLNCSASLDLLELLNRDGIGVTFVCKSAVNVQKRWRCSDDVVKESDSESNEGQRGGTHRRRRSRLHEGLCMFEHPVLLLLESLLVQFRTHQPPYGLIVFIQPLKLEGEQTNLNESHRCTLLACEKQVSGKCE